MTSLLDHAIDVARMLPTDVQDEIARIVLTYADEEAVAVDLTPEEEGAALLSRAAAARGELATDEQMQAIWAKHGL